MANKQLKKLQVRGVTYEIAINADHVTDVTRNQTVQTTLDDIVTAVDDLQKIEYKITVEGTDEGVAALTKTTN